MNHVAVGRVAALSLLVATTLGCSWFRGAPDAPAKIADRMRQDPVPYDRLVAEAGKGPKRNVLWLREATLAELALGATTDAVRRRWGEPTRTRQTAAGTWWIYEEVYPKPGFSPEPEPSDLPPDERREPVAARVGMNLTLLFVDPPKPAATPMPAPTPAPVAPATPAPSVPPSDATAIEIVPPPEAGTPAEAPTAPPAPPTPTPPPPKVLAHIQAWSPARFQTRSLVRVLDLASRVERKYGKAPQVLPWGREGGEVWLYPAANVGFVVTPAWEEQPRHVAASLVGF